MLYQITGKIDTLGPTLTVTSKDGTRTFNRRSLVLDCTRFDPNTGEPWPNFPQFEFSGQRCFDLDLFKVGQRVVVDFALSGVKYQDKQTNEPRNFTSVRGVKIQLASSVQPAAPVEVASQAVPEANEDGEMPF